MEKEAPCIIKRLKVITGNRCMDSIDRLSSLPDAVLHHILSFLPTKRSVQTSILSRIWRHLWTHVPDIDFDGSHFWNTDLELDGGKRLSDIIYRVMLQYKVQGMNNFRLIYNKNCGLPLCIFTYASLVDLMLFQCGPIPMLDFVRLPALNKLQIHDVSYKSEFGCLTTLLSGCPVLEELNLVSENVPPGCQVAPRLYASTGYALYATVLPFLGSLCYVTRLQLATGLIAHPENVFSAVLVKFPNLLEVTPKTKWRFIPFFLENANNLKKFTVATLDNRRKWWIEPHAVPSCLFSSLRFIRLLCFTCTKQEFQMVAYVLRNAKVLERVELSLPRL
ncbi:Unknown protein [Striga hermonthica]|uniref:F-box domain-containing protein n=1 Tax=Striga hermonthica TaxID=68872 RepID=A0A9N7MX46_STRHE|nr:Unknown protein [Striga hermonthica]